jgi:hypothetical protein
MKACGSLESAAGNGQRNPSNWPNDRLRYRTTKWNS